jgi:hypothetical protein
MKWKHPPAPRLGDERTETRFAWLPTKLDDGYTVWLETYSVHLRYEACMVPTKFGYIRAEQWNVFKTETLWVFL